MKKILLTSALILSIAGLAPASVLGEENTTQSTSAVKEAIAKEEKKESSVEENSKSEVLPKVDVQEDKPKKEGWYQENHHWRFYQDDKPALNWKQIQGKWYYFDQDGNRLHSTVYKGYAFDQDGVMTENSWTKLDNQWYYADSSGRLAQNTWKKINGSWYYFDQTGSMLSNTAVDGYLLTKSGAMAEKGWTKLDQIWYYVAPSGKISQDKWEKINGSWYYFDKDGGMLSATTFKGYLFNQSGAMAENNWVKIKDTWFYANGSGRYVQENWQKIQGSWYSFDQNGGMLADKWKESYYLKTSGAMAENEWIFDKAYKSWFYLKADGRYANQEWIGAYYLKSGGYMAKSEWIYDNSDKARYYLDDNGHYVSGTYKIDGKEHLFQKYGQWISEVSTEGGFVKGQYSNTIFLDPGHGGRDSGAFYYNVAEKDLNMQIYRKLRSKLEELGYKVLTSRDSDIDVDFVTERSRMVNKTNSDIFISIHFNATGNTYSKASGIQTYSYSDEPDYPSKINKYWHNHPDRMSESKRLATAIHSSLLAETGAKDAGLLESSYAVLRETAKPAVLLELGYMDNFSENQQIRDSHYQDKLVAGIVKGIQKYYAGP
ncbi:putative endo-beta-N-acetylglucosaminidase precursor [Streptococcus sp. BCA20]|uniref:N-acetylmuramoyl-L-alanine amidase n=1 Tax=Streptococcus TaxID=1301 RepID=UPI0001F88FA1|nr:MULTISPECIES: N-acetylmuramoyl-L-alanine amidase [Streptococcus]RSJ39056.1 putative endo-beta-N-acetylglucosaminidase precursor [Streptococcus sp. BCA20]EFX57228.1 N-acetylmuramoyl-L-alanine amidase [Streptococcus sp. C300]MCY7062154.1 N-acetylmuramoyl-L-alanine amidase [Streptococcus oralis]MCY7087060.1 N-acetylmuramoyl-L-alanine amidase [Streptococcus oralis]MDK7170815.1 N-acetylmuramoyl-L-alanine amidase [Streptococcus oralis]